MCVTLVIGWILVSLQYFDTVATYTIPSGSMQPTLLVGDYVIAVKHPYRDRLPLRGEVVVFVGPGGSDYVKRVIGLPGDRIQVSRGILRVNGERVSRRRIEDFVAGPGQETMAQPVLRYVETLPGGFAHPILERSDDGPRDDTEVYSVPEGHIFVMGDNRDNSVDSRDGSVGFVALDRLLDRPLCIYWAEDPARIGRAVR
jgi:signal peptidase I